MERLQPGESFVQPVAGFQMCSVHSILAGALDARIVAPTRCRCVEASTGWVELELELELGVALQGGRLASAFVRRAMRGLQPRYEVMSGDAVVISKRSPSAKRRSPTPKAIRCTSSCAHSASMFSTACGCSMIGISSVCTLLRCV